MWIISPAARSPCGIAFRGVPALLGSLVIFITSLQIWAQSCNSFRNFSPLPSNLYGKASLTVLETGVWIQGAGFSWGGEEVKKASYWMALKRSSVGSKNSTWSHIKALTLLQVLQHGDRAHVSSCCCVVLYSRCASAMLSVQCNRTSRGSPLFSEICCWQCSHTVITISCFYQQIILLPSRGIKTSVPLMSCSLNKKHHHFHQGPKSQLSEFPGGWRQKREQLANG